MISEGDGRYRIVHKRLVTIMLLGACLLCGSKAYGEETKNYESKSSTGFYGVYEYPKEEEKPPLPETGGKSDPQPERTYQQNSAGKVLTVLPQTGDQPYWLMGGPGLLMLGMGIYLSLKKQQERRI